MRTPLPFIGVALLALCNVGCNMTRVMRAGNETQSEDNAASVLELARIGETVPEFTLGTAHDTLVRLSDYRGKIVVLEWLNPDCPFTRYAHQSGTLQNYPNELRAQGIVWLGINSASNQRLGGGLDSTREAIAAWGIEFPVLIDDTGKVGRQYDATTTPEVFVINPEGVLVYAGAVDNMPFGKVRGGAEGQNYLAQVIAQLRAGDDVVPAYRQSYGCRVKYAQPSRLD